MASCCLLPKTTPKGAAAASESENGRNSKIHGTLVLMKKNVLDFHDAKASFLDRIHELLGKGVSLQLISSLPDPGHLFFLLSFSFWVFRNGTVSLCRSKLTVETSCPLLTCSANGLSGKIGKAAFLEKWAQKMTPVTATDTAFTVTFDWDHTTMGVPGAFIIRNHHHSQFYLKTLTLDHVPNHGRIHFVCNSWVYPVHRYKYHRVFFSNKTYLPCQTPEPLRKYREEELVNLRGNGKGELKEWDRVYDYAYYNDLGSPDKGEAYARPVIGGSKDYPYPRRGRTGRKPTNKDPNSESRLPLVSLDIYVPRDERFGHVKFSDFLAYGLKSIVQVLVPEIYSLSDKTINEFDSFEDVFNLYEGGIKLPSKAKISKIRNNIPWELLKELVRNDGERFLKFPTPDVIKEDKSAWRTDEEFAREMLAGVNPVIISRLREFPPASQLDPKEYGNQHSTMKKEDLELNMDGLTVDEAIASNRLFILDHHDALMLYLRKINSTTTKTEITMVLSARYSLQQKLELRAQFGN
ncbi:Linoleate 9S-lipoxygenase 5 [Linum grandiflorum]